MRQKSTIPYLPVPACVTSEEESCAEGVLVTVHELINDLCMCAQPQQVLQGIPIALPVAMEIPTGSLDV